MPVKDTWRHESVSVQHPFVRVMSMKNAQPEQLSLLTRTDVPVQFRLDRQTRQRGLAHIATLRQLLADRNSPSPMQAVADAGTAVATASRDQAA